MTIFTGIAGFTGLVETSGVTKTVGVVDAATGSTRIITPLDEIVSSTLIDLEATSLDSTDGVSQTWANLTAQSTTYDAWRGVDANDDTDDPTFNGTAGDAAAYWSTDGGDTFYLKAQPAFFRDIHKTTGGSDFWLAFVFQIPLETPATGLCATQSGNTTQGLRVNIISGDTIALVQRGDTGNASLTSSGTITEASPALVIVSHSHSGNTTKFFINSRTKEESAHTFNATTTDATAIFHVLASTTLALPSGSRFYGFSAGNEYISDANAALIIDEYNTRHERTYA